MSHSAGSRLRPAGLYDRCMHFLKGHGTGNDFVLLPDPEGALELPPWLVAAICDRRRGIGADGVLRVVRADLAPEAAGTDAAAATTTAEWFMDHRNADGGLPEMCGNGVRVYARYLVDAGLATPGQVPILTRAGVKWLEVPASGDVRVDMGRPEVDGSGSARIAGTPYEGLRIALGNPHLACVVAGSISGIDLSAPPSVDADAFPGGVNVELVRRLDPDRVVVRVYERGVGETTSCGTGAVAAAAAAAHYGQQRTGRWLVDTPGGRLTVTLDGRTSYLVGPAMLVASGDLNPDRLVGQPAPDRSPALGSRQAQ